MEVTFQHAERQLLQALAARRFTPWSTLDECIEAERRSLARGFDRLLSLDELDMELYDHQRRAVLRVLQDMRGRALLADEVGLGKTIEAGVVLKEYIVRGLADKVLILVPAPLTEQWRAELREKLAIEARINRELDGWDRHDCIIASLDTAKRPDHAARIHAISWDVVIVDEAHRLKNRNTAAWRFVDGIRKKYILLLTATPIQNDLEELYNMMTLLKPGLLKTYSTFKQDFMVDKRSPKQVERLRAHVREVMIRSTRHDCSVPFPNRVVESVPVRLTGLEREFYDDVLSFARRAYGKVGGGNVLPLILLLRELCSSPQAARRTLMALQDGERDWWPAEERAAAARLGDRAALLGVRPSKLETALAVMQRHGEPMIVFTEFRATQDALYDALASLGVPTVKFHGEMNNDQRRAAVDAFRSRGGVLISTEAGGEGQNLQFCRTVMNYDLPWNPMRIEQRIGRVHRLGQERDVVVINLYTEETIETYVYRLLHDKIRLFQQVIGDLDLILSAVSEEQTDASFVQTVGQLILGAVDDQQLQDGFAAIGRRLERARLERENVHRLNESVFGRIGIVPNEPSDPMVSKAATGGGTARRDGNGPAWPGEKRSVGQPEPEAGPGVGQPESEAVQGVGPSPVSVDQQPLGTSPGRSHGKLRHGPHDVSHGKSYPTAHDEWHGMAHQQPHDGSHRTTLHGPLDGSHRKSHHTTHRMAHDVSHGELCDREAGTVASPGMMASVLHPLCVDVEFARGVLTDEPVGHPAVSAMRTALNTLRFENVRTRTVQSRLVHHRHLLFWFKTSYRSDETREQLHTLLLDPVTEQVRPLPTLHDAIDIGWDTMDGGPKTDRSSDGPVQRNGLMVGGFKGNMGTGPREGGPRKAGARVGGTRGDETKEDGPVHGVGVGEYAFKRLYRRAIKHVAAEVKRRGRSHQAEARTRLARDKARLQAYYDGLQAESLAPMARDLRRLEAARTRQRLMASIFNTASENPYADGEEPSRLEFPGSHRNDARIDCEEETAPQSVPDDSDGGQVEPTEPTRSECRQPRPDNRRVSKETTIQRQLRQWEEQVKRTTEALAAEQQRRIDELERKYEVRADVAPLGSALLWVPRVEWRFKLLGHVRREIVFYYDPLQETFIDLTCDECGAPTTTVYACTEGDLVCPDCYVPCSACDIPLCVGCVPRRCHICARALCSECQTLCPEAADATAATGIGNRERTSGDPDTGISGREATRDGISNRDGIKSGTVIEDGQRARVGSGSNGGRRGSVDVDGVHGDLFVCPDCRAQVCGTCKGMTEFLVV